MVIVPSYIASRKEGNHTFLGISGGLKSIPEFSMILRHDILLHVFQLPTACACQRAGVSVEQCSQHNLPYAGRIYIYIQRVAD